MRCPHCGSDDDKVVDSRTLANGEAIRRRRECLSCGFRFTSYERIEEKPLMVVKRDGRREPFERSKLEKGVARALEKRPISQLSIENLVNEIEDEAAMRGKTVNEITTVELGEMVLARLYSLDKVAYVRFASVYRKFETLEEFLEVIEGLVREPALSRPRAVDEAPEGGSRARVQAEPAAPDQQGGSRRADGGSRQAPAGRGAGESLFGP